jgi:hypothetical protein
MTLKIDLLKIDMDACKHWMRRVREQSLKRRHEAVTAKHRAKWLDKQGRHDEAEKVRAKND